MSSLNGFSHLLSIGTICLLVGGTLAAKNVFLVDNDLETQAKLNAANWQFDAPAARKYTGDMEKLAYNYVDRLSKLPDRQSWCGSSREISVVLAKANSLKLIELKNLSPGKADIAVKLPQVLSPNKSKAGEDIKQLHLYVNPAQQSAGDVESWCIATKVPKVKK
jgi:hypothetical protein